MSYGIFDHLIASGFDMERIGTAREYFAKRRYQTSQAYFGEEDSLEETKSVSKDKKQSRGTRPSSGTYDVETEQERKETRDLEKKIQRDTIMGKYVPSYMEKEM